MTTGQGPGPVPPPSPNGAAPLPNASIPRPLVNVTNAALAGEWLRGNIGSAVLSGYLLRDGRIVHTPREGESGYLEPINPHDSDGPAQVRLVDAAHIAATVNWQCWPYKQKDAASTPSPARLTVEIAKDAVSRPDLCPRLRVLRRVVHTPVVRRDGSILSTPGYDPSSGFLYLPPAGLSVTVPVAPSLSDVSSSVALLSEMLDGFVWAGEHDMANFLGILLTPLLTSLVPPPYKLGVISAPQPGSGKTLLAGVARILHGGVFRSEMPEDDAELRKQVSAILDTTTGPVVVIDNVTGVLRSSTLSGLLTSGVWDDRRLGSNDVISRTNDRFWLLTGNNVTLGGDLARRALWVTIDPKVPHPERRTGFAIPVLERWVADNRGRLLSALLTLVRAWVNAGMPLPAEDRSDVYTSWRQVIRGILANAGVAGTFDDVASARQDIGGDDDEWRDFCAAIHAHYGSSGWLVRDLLAKVNTIGATNDVARPIQLDALPSELVERIERASRNASTVAKSLGRWLMNREGRWAGQYCIRADGQDSQTKSRRWKVELNPANPLDAGVWRSTGLSSQTYARNTSSFYTEVWGNNPVDPHTPESASDMLMER